jgi:hypothetical protein
MENGLTLTGVGMSAALIAAAISSGAITAHPDQAGTPGICFESRYESK